MAPWWRLCISTMRTSSNNNIDIINNHNNNKSLLLLLLLYSTQNSCVHALNLNRSLRQQALLRGNGLVGKPPKSLNIPSMKKRPRQYDSILITLQHIIKSLSPGGRTRGLRPKCQRKKPTMATISQRLQRKKKRKPGIRWTDGERWRRR
jgi:hypothetical protein